MKPIVMLLDGWPLIEKVCGVRNFTESLVQTIDKSYKDVSLHVAIPIFSGFEEQFHLPITGLNQHLSSLKNHFKNTIIHEFLIPRPYLIFLEATTNLLRIQKRKTLARFIWHTFLLSKLVKQLSPQIILHPTQEVGSKQGGAFTIGIIHDTFGFEHLASRENRNFIERLIYRYMYRGVYLNNVKHADLLLTVSNITKIDLHLLYGIAFDKIVTIYEGAHSSFEQFTPDKTQAVTVAEKYNLPKKYILSTNPESYRKYPATILHALKSLIHKHPDLHLVFFGTGTHEKVTEYSAHLGLQEKILFLGEIAPENLPYIYHNAQCLIFNTLAEGFGLPVLEAMWAQTPVIASRVGPLFEIFKDNIMYVDPFDPNELHTLLIQIIDNKSLREKIVSRQLQAAQQYAWTKISSVLMPILKSMPHEPQNGSFE